MFDGVNDLDTDTDAAMPTRLEFYRHFQHVESMKLF